MGSVEEFFRMPTCRFAAMYLTLPGTADVFQSGDPLEILNRRRERRGLPPIEK